MMMSKHPQLMDKAWLENELKTKSKKRVSEELGCSPTMVTNWRCIHKIGKPATTKYTELMDKEWLVKEVASKYVSQIARDVGCDTHLVYLWCAIHGIEIPYNERRGRGKIEIDKDWLESELKLKSCYQISKDIDCSTETVIKRAREYGLGHLIQYGRRPRTKNRCLYDADWLIDNCDRDPKEVAKELGCTTRWVKQAFKEYANFGSKKACYLKQARYLLKHNKLPETGCGASVPQAGQ